MDCAPAPNVAAPQVAEGSTMMHMQLENHHWEDNVEADNNNMVVETAIGHETVDNDEGIIEDVNNLEPLCGDDAVGNDGDNNVGDDNDVGDVMDIINQSLIEFLAKAQEEADKATEVASKKREEANVAEAEAEEIKGRMDILREKAQTLADDEKWTSMYERLRVWSREHGHCNPKRNWKAKIDAEEKALGNWSGKQRREERLGQLNLFKKCLLERMGFAFNTNEHKWDKFHENLMDYVSKHGKIPKTIDLKGTDLYCPLIYYRAQAKRCIGLSNDSELKKKGWNNERFTQERIDVLTEAGLDWQLQREHVIELKEKHNFTFPMPKEPERRELEISYVPTLMKHHWLSMFEALVEFKRRNGHTYVLPSNSTPELVWWVEQQRKKMQHLRIRTLMDNEFRDYQAEMLLGLDFVYNQADVEWYDNYERLAAYKRLFGVLAVTDKFCSFELLEQWLDDEKRNHLNLPLLLAHRTVSSVRLGRENVTIPKEERLRLLNEIGAFDVPIGKEEKALRKSHFFFRTTEQVFEYGPSLKSRRDMKEFEEMKAKGPSYDTSPIDAQKEASESSPTLSTTVYHINNYAIDADKEIGFFLQRGAIVSASLDERKKLQSCGQGRKYFDDGRPFTLCRISGCFTNHQAAKNHYFCRRHYTMIEGYTACDAIASKNSSKEISQDNTLMTSNATMTKAAGKSASNETNSDDTLVNSNATMTKAASKTPNKEANNSDDTPINPTATEIYGCSHCDNRYNSFNEAAIHEKNCDCWSVQETTKIAAPINLSSNPPWTEVPISENLEGEAKVLAEDYRYNVWKLAIDYRKKSIAKPNIKNKHTSAALGDESHFTDENESYCLPVVRYPSKEEELEHINLFRRLTGPLAATLSGRAKLENEGCLFYGDGRPLRFCRVAGCQMVHSDNHLAKYLCDWHFGVLKRPLDKGTKAPNKRRCQEAYTKAKKATKTFHASGPRKQTGAIDRKKQLAHEKFTRAYKRAHQLSEVEEGRYICVDSGRPNERREFSVVVPPGQLGIVIENRKDLPGTIVVKVQQGNPVAKAIKAGDRIISIDGENVSQKTVNEVSAKFAQKNLCHRTLIMLPAAKSENPQKPLEAAPEVAAEGTAASTHQTTPAATATQPEQSIGSDIVMPSVNCTLSKTVEREVSAMAVKAPLVPAAKLDTSENDTSTMAVEAPLEPAHSEMNQFIDC